jgi:acyl-CoA hydrolase
MKKTAVRSLTTMTEMVLPNDTNTFNKLMGGKLMYWIDVIGAIAAQKHSNSLVVTASVDNISFGEPIDLGHVLTLKAQVTRAFNTSMEVFVEVFAEDIPKQHRYATNKAFLTFVAVDRSGKPMPVAELIPETEEEIALYEGALRRRQLRLVLAGKMKPNDADALKALFDMGQVLDYKLKSN